MAEPLTKEELALARGYAESVYSDTSDPQKHAAAVMMLRLLDTLATLEAENARLRPLAEVGEAVEGMPVDGMLLRRMETYWLAYKHADFTGWDGMEDWHEIQAENPCDEEGCERWAGDTALAALRAAKEAGHAH